MIHAAIEVGVIVGLHYKLTEFEFASVSPLVRVNWILYLILGTVLGIAGHVNVIFDNTGWAGLFLANKHYSGLHSHCYERAWIRKAVKLLI